MIYLACPYSHKTDPTMPERRYEYVTRVAAYFMTKGHNIFSPITHSHPIAVLSKSLGLGVPMYDWDFWKKQDFDVLRHCSELWILQINGWKESVGVNAEADLARTLGIPVKFINPYETFRGVLREQATTLVGGVI